jgi:hypothetical protein
MNNQVHLYGWRENQHEAFCADLHFLCGRMTTDRCICLLTRVSLWPHIFQAHLMPPLSLFILCPVNKGAIYMVREVEAIVKKIYVNWPLLR